MARGNGVEASQSLYALYVNTQGVQVPWAKTISVYSVKETHYENTEDIHFSKLPSRGGLSPATSQDNNSVEGTQTEDN